LNALERELRAMIADEGPLSIERWMQLCLQHPVHGYYTTREAIGRAGDFITAPEIHQMFGELLGLWAAQVWLDAGAPAPIRLVELGPGRGTLMADALRATRIVPDFHAALAVDMVETSPRLEAAQRAALAGVTPDVVWRRTIDEVPAGPALILANEFFDALPVRHYVRGAKGWHERVVGLDAEDRLVFGAAGAPVDVGGVAGAPGQMLEVGHASLRAMETLAARIATQGGALLVCDYGHAESGLGETLQAVRGHAYADPLADPGEADLTTHVDFAALSRTATAAGAVAHGPVEQGRFLQRLGIESRAEALRRRADTRQAAAIDAALHRLTSPESSMATIFKVLAVVPQGAPMPPGFEERDA
jgi:NADH dehydrogenase [ubiquinone] 1 alpha subcomplex assembly factor 7